MTEATAIRPNKVRVLLELVKFEHSVFALPYAYIGAIYGAAMVPLAMPTRWPTVANLLWITVAMVGARSVAFAINRAVDKEIDARNPRTSGRAVPAGLIRAWELWTFAALMLAAYLYAVFQLAPIVRVLWPVPILMFIVYPYLKRVTPLAHFWLGACLGLGTVGGWVAVGASLAHPAPWLLGAAVAVWTGGFDIIYATQDYSCDVRDGLHSVPADFGMGNALTLTKAAHVASVALFVAGGLMAGAGWPYHLGVAMAAGLLAYENAILSPDDLSRVDTAFFNVNGAVAVVVLLGAVADRLLAG